MPHMADTWSVSDLNRYVKQALETDYRLQGVRVTGEISGFKVYPSGHWYFTLKDAHAQISCVLWRARADRQRYRPREGDAVEAHGNITLYETRGQYQLDVAWLQLGGEGALYADFARLKAQLEAEGLFDPARKRPLPARPRLIGLVTSPAGAALRDMLNILQRRWPLAEVLLSPAQVQGSEAPAQIVAALQALESFAPEVIIVGRGGGAMEDLWAFNDERVARAIAAAPVPVVSGVGHETDFTIADFVADVRAPTPSAAAELVSRISVADLRAAVDSLSEQLQASLEHDLQMRQLALAHLSAELKGLSPGMQLAQARQRVEHLQMRAFTALRHRLALEAERTQRLTQALNAINPLAVLERGYAVVTKANGQLVRRIAEVKAPEVLQVRVHDGAFKTQVVK